MEYDESKVVATVVRSEQRAGPQERPWRLVLKLFFSAGILALIAWVVNWREFAEIVASARLELLLLAGMLLAVGNLMIAWRWQVLLVPVGIHTTLLQALKSYLKGHFMAYFVPSGVTGDVVKALDMNSARTRGRRAKGIELASSIFIERGFGAITVGMAVVLGLLISPLAGDYADLQEVVVLSAAAIMVCCVLALFADKFTRLVPRSALHRWPRFGALVARAQDSFVAYRRAPARLVSVMLLSVAIQALRVLPVYVVALAVGAGAAFFPFLIAVPVIYLANMVPVVGSRIGAEQGLFVLFLGMAGVAPEAALAVALVSLALGILVALPGGFWLINSRVFTQARP